MASQDSHLLQVKVIQYDPIAFRELSEKEKEYPSSETEGALQVRVHRFMESSDQLSRNHIFVFESYQKLIPHHRQYR